MHSQFSLYPNCRCKNFVVMQLCQVHQLAKSVNMLHCSDARSNKNKGSTESSRDSCVCSAYLKSYISST